MEKFCMICRNNRSQIFMICAFFTEQNFAFLFDIRFQQIIFTQTTFHTHSYWIKNFNKKKEGQIVMNEIQIIIKPYILHKFIFRY